MRAGLCKAGTSSSWLRLSATSRPPIPRSLYIPHARCWIWAQKAVCVSMGQEGASADRKRTSLSRCTLLPPPENLRRRCGRYR